MRFFWTLREKIEKMGFWGEILQTQPHQKLDLTQVKKKSSVVIKLGSLRLTAVTTGCGLGDWGSIPGQGKTLTPGFVFK